VAHPQINASFSRKVKRMSIESHNLVVAIAAAPSCNGGGFLGLNGSQASEI
jgi:hypothetical protein